MITPNNDLAAKRAAIAEARNSTRPSVPAAEAIKIFKANLEKVRKKTYEKKGQTTQPD